MARKKKAWNATNPLYRYLHSKRAGKSRKSRSRGVSRMVRHKRASHRRGGFGGSGIKGLLESFFIGAGAATISEKVIPQVIPYQNIAIGAAAGYLKSKTPMSAAAGVAGVLARDMLKISPTGVGITTTGY